MGRPTSVTVIAIVNVIGGFASICFGGSILLACLASLLNVPDQVRVDYQVWLAFVNPFLFVILGIVLVISGMGLLMMGYWARRFTISIGLLEFAHGLATLMFGLIWPPFLPLDGGLGHHLVTSAYALLIAWFLTRPSVVEAFRVANWKNADVSSIQ